MQVFKKGFLELFIKPLNQGSGTGTVRSGLD